MPRHRGITKHVFLLGPWGPWAPATSSPPPDPDPESGHLEHGPVIRDILWSYMPGYRWDATRSTSSRTPGATELPSSPGQAPNPPSARSARTGTAEDSPSSSPD